MGKPKISIILATHNRKEMLPRMMDSLKKQTFKEYELILIDDGSSDGTEGLCDSYAEQDERIRVIHINPNGGLSNARNVGVQAAQTEFVSFVDDDDFCEEDMFQHLYDLISKNHADIAVTGCVDEYPDKIVPKYVYDELKIFDKVQGLECFLKRELYHTAPPTKLFRKSLFDNIKFIKGAGFDDIHVMYKIFAEADKVACQGLPMYRFRKHEDNITAYITTNKITAKILDEYFKMQKNRVAYICEKVPQLSERVRYEEYSYLISMYDKVITYNCEGCETQLTYIQERLKGEADVFLDMTYITEREKELMRKYILG